MSVELIEKLNREKKLSHEEWVEIFETLVAHKERRSSAATASDAHPSDLRQKAWQTARQTARRIARQIAVEQFGNKVFARGLIEFTSYCRNDCYYCGIRRSNKDAERYRLSEEDILECCGAGYKLGFRTFVLQGGEDPGYTAEVGEGQRYTAKGGEDPAYTAKGGDDPGRPAHEKDGGSRPDRITAIVSAIKEKYPDCAVTLSFGEHPKEVYAEWKRAGADRYLLRHETADDDHYRMLHPGSMSPERRKQCLWDLKDLGYQVGTGFMVGSPGQTAETLAKDMLFIRELEPQMVGIGPFVPHRRTAFADEAPGTVEMTLDCIALLRIMLPKALIPATTALGTIDPGGREKGILAGANVVMPNLSPKDVRSKYDIYDNKVSTGREAAESLALLKESFAAIGCELDMRRGDHPDFAV